MKFFLLFLSLVSSSSIFNSLAYAQQAPARPDCKSEPHRQFDFWVGNWVVTDKENNVVGYNRIDLILNNCALQENWEGGKGSNGKSFNFYDRQTQKWHQTWVDNSGGILYLDGELQGNVMVLKGTRLGRGGKTVLHKINYTPMKDGRVKQHWKASGDKGETWNDVFLGFYEKRGSKTSM